MFQLLSNTDSSQPITFVNVGTVGTGVNPTAALPSGWATGDLLVIVGASGSSFTAPSGWNVSLNSTSTSPRLIYVWKIATSGETNVTITNASSNASVAMFAWRNVSGVDTNGTQNTSSSTSAVTTTLTTTIANSVVISAFGGNSNATPFTGTPASTNIRLNYDGSGVGAKPFLVVDEIKTVAGATTARTATMASSQPWITFASSFKQS